MTRSVFGWVSIGALLIGCSGGDDNDGGDKPPTVDSGSYHRYVVDKLTLPGNAAEANKFAFDIDGVDDPQDNKLGSILSLLKTQGGVQLQPAIDDSIAQGNLILLSEIRADELASDDSVSWQVFLGQSKENPDFTGGGTFERDPSFGGDAKLIGGIASNVFEGGPGRVPLALALDAGNVLQLDLYGARIRARVTEDAVEDPSDSDVARLGGAITATDLDEKILPALAELADGYVMTDCTCTGGNRTCTEGSRGGTIAGLFDKAPQDCSVTVDEVRNDTAVQTIAVPDVDLFDANGQPGSDGTPDSLSLGVGIHLVKAAFESPNE